MGVGDQCHSLATLSLVQNRYPLYKRLGGLQGRAGQMLEISPQPGFEPWTVQPVASHCTDWAVPALNIMLSCMNVTVCLQLQVLTRIWCWSLQFVVTDKSFYWILVRSLIILYISLQAVYWVKYYGLMGITVASFLGDSGSDLGPETSYPDWGF